jgi:peptide/nickel transport system permease protein
MIVYLLGRLARGVLTVFGVVTIAFGILRLNGSPAVTMIPTATVEQIAQLNHSLGFDGSLPSQYWRFLVGLAHLDIGKSLQSPASSALSVVFMHLGATLELTLSAFGVGLLGGFLIALILQVTGSQRLRNAMIWIGVTRQALPTFLFGVLLVLLFSVKLGWLPSIGRGGWQHLLLPTLTLATFEVTLYMRLIDSSLSEQQELDYVRTARAKGLPGIVVLLRHMLPNALLPLLTIAGLNFGALLGGAVIVENVFNWPGIGQLLIYSVRARDYPVVQATLLVVAVAFVTVNIVVDLLYAALDPRVRLR